VSLQVDWAFAPSHAQTVAKPRQVFEIELTGRRAAVGEPEIRHQPGQGPIQIVHKQDGIAEGVMQVTTTSRIGSVQLE
jgi:hypothetical protein